VTIEFFDAHLLVPSTLHDACYARSVVTVALVDLHLQGRLRVPGIDADDAATWSGLARTPRPQAIEKSTRRLKPV
jgi:hypothetical protein